jgi:hypothetical protein
VALELGLLEAIDPGDPLVETRRLHRTPEPAEPALSHNAIKRDARFHLLRTQAEDIHRFASENPFARVNLAA